MTTSTAPNWLHLEGAANVRDVGGLPLRDGGVVRERVLIRSDNLQGLTPADIATLEDLGVREIVDLRHGKEVEKEGPGPLVAAGLRHHHLSVVPEVGENTDMDAEKVLALRKERWEQGPVSVYQGYLQDGTDAIVGAVRVIATTEGAAIAHCAAGKDRTGTVVALILDAVGVERAAVVADYAASSEAIDGVLRRLTGSDTYAKDLEKTDRDVHLSKPETMEGLLRWLDDTWGGAAGWLTAHGLTEDELAALRARLT
ncbi:MAG TPA: tyrosine-protein phosphatase [Mycobacteriales bacterium]|nr:tyrosine-protein phosphatase [Mycobacteriales bacterium]